MRGLKHCHQCGRAESFLIHFLTTRNCLSHVKSILLQVSAIHSVATRRWVQEHRKRVQLISKGDIYCAEQSLQLRSNLCRSRSLSRSSRRMAYLFRVAGRRFLFIHWFAACVCSFKLPSRLSGLAD